MSNGGKSAELACSFDYHNDAFFGLAREDVVLSKTKNKYWNYPSLANKRGDENNINRLNDDLEWH